MRNGTYIIKNIYHSYWNLIGKVANGDNGMIVFIPNDPRYEPIYVEESDLMKLL